MTLSLLWPKLFTALLLLLIAASVERGRGRARVSTGT